MHQNDIEVKISWLQSHGGPSRVNKTTTGWFPNWEGTYLMGPQVKFTWNSDLPAIASQISPVFTRKHMTTQISCKYHDKKEKRPEKTRMIPFHTCKPIRSTKTRSKNEKEGQKGWE